MGQHSDSLCLIVELAAELLIGGKLLAQDLHRHKTVQTMAFGLVDHSGATHADDLQQFVAVIQHCSDILIHGDTSFQNAISTIVILSRPPRLLAMSSRRAQAVSGCSA